MAQIFNEKNISFELRQSPIPEFSWHTSKKLSEIVKSKHLQFDVKSLDAGKYSYPYHFHRNSEEIFVILSGKATLRTPNEFVELNKGDIVFFEIGPEGTHQLYNHTEEPCMFIDIGTNVGLDVCEYPDSGKINILPNQEVYQSNHKVDYYNGEDKVSEKWPDIVRVSNLKTERLILIPMSLDIAKRVEEGKMRELNIGVPTIEEATLILDEGSKLNPGPWVEHSLFVGKAAELIAREDKELDGDIALALGMLHDIGRRYGVTSMRHSIDGYNFSMEKGYSLLARICISHSFSYKNIDAVFGKWDCSDKEYKFVKEYLDKIDFTAYDKLIQLCDALALPSGYCLMEKRMLDVAMRHGVNEYTIEKWKAIFEIKSFFEERIGKSIYSVLPNVVENTFNF